MKKLSVVVSALFLILLTVVTTLADSDKSPWSAKTYSDNKNYIFVLISNESLNDYEVKTRKSWEPLQLSPQELKDYESGLARNLQQEEETRRTYSNSGLYAVGNTANPLWLVSLKNTEEWTTKMDEKYIASDGSYVIGYNPHVAEVKNDVPNKEEVGVFIYSTGFGLKSYKVSELTNYQDVFAKSMHGYYWANKDLKIDEQHKTFTLIKQNQKDKLEFNINTGEILSNSSEEKHSGCLSFIFLFVLAIVLS